MQEADELFKKVKDIQKDKGFFLYVIDSLLNNQSTWLDISCTYQFYDTHNRGKIAEAVKTYMTFGSKKNLFTEDDLRQLDKQFYIAGSLFYTSLAKRFWTAMLDGEDKLITVQLLQYIYEVASLFRRLEKDQDSYINDHMCSVALVTFYNREIGAYSFPDLPNHLDSFTVHLVNSFDIGPEKIKIYNLESQIEKHLEELNQLFLKGGVVID